MSQEFPTEETIAALATAVGIGQGSVGIVRVSGAKALEVGESIITIQGDKVWDSHKVLYGHVMDINGKERIDEVLTFAMKAPRSFTGEDVIEIQCHGGALSIRRVLERVLQHPGVRRALPGEFSQRAVLNGRINLTQAEALSELIGARSVKAAKLAMAGLDGGIQTKINKLRNQLLDQLSELEARVDFEDDLPHLNNSMVLKKLRAIRSELETLILDSKRGIHLRQGLKIAIVGAPNVGKSSLINRISKRELAIVTSVPGTTRDILESEIVLEGIPIILLDTAGIRATKDPVEIIGIEKTHQTLISADVIIQVYDVSIGWTDEDEELSRQIPSETTKLLIGNKIDIYHMKPKIGNLTNKYGSNANLVLSALTGEGEDQLIKALLEAGGAHETQGIELALNERQIDLASQALSALIQIEEAAKQKLPWDFWTIDLRQAIYSLGSITGQEITESLLDRIFSKFCIGK